jgi:hypothetical protein
MFLLGFYYENKNLCVIQDEKNKIELIEDENLAIKYMLMTIENGKDNDKMQMGDAAMSLGCIYGERKDKENMRKYFSLCEAITPDEQKRKEAMFEREKAILQTAIPTLKVEQYSDKMKKEIAELSAKIKELEVEKSHFELELRHNTARLRNGLEIEEQIVMRYPLIGIMRI